MPVRPCTIGPMARSRSGARSSWSRSESTSWPSSCRRVSRTTDRSSSFEKTLKITKPRRPAITRVGSSSCRFISDLDVDDLPHPGEADQHHHHCGDEEDHAEAVLGEASDVVRVHHVHDEPEA